VPKRKAMLEPANLYLSPNPLGSTGVEQCLQGA
jgi:hypothetical protein